MELNTRYFSVVPTNRHQEKRFTNTTQAVPAQFYAGTAERYPDSAFTAYPLLLPDR